MRVFCQPVLLLRICLLCLGLAVYLIAPTVSCAQNPLTAPLTGSKEKTEDKKEEKQQEDSWQSVKDWRSSAQERLKAVRARIKEAEGDEETKLTAKKKQQEELLSWLDLTLSQLESERKKEIELAEYLKTEQDQLEKFLTEGLKDGDTSFVELDRARDELATKQGRLKRTENRVKAATEQFETAQKERKERASARRIAREAVETNSDDAKRQKLGDALAEAELLCEIGEANSQKREQELTNAKTTLEAQQAHIKMLDDKVARLEQVATFGEQELQNLIEELQTREKNIELSISRAVEAENELSILEQMWLRAQQRIDSGQGDKEALTAEVEGYKISSRALRERTRLLREQSEIVSGHLNIWKRRQALVEGKPERKEVAKWEGEAEQAVELLEGQEKAALLDIEDLKSELEQAEQRSDEAGKGTGIAKALERQIKGYESLLDENRQHLATVRESIKLHTKLLDELDAGSITDTAKDQFLAVWQGIKDIWNLELTNFGNNPLTVRKVVVAVLLLLIGILVSRSISRFLGAQVLRRIDIDPSASATIQSLFFYTLLLIFTLFSLKVVNVPLTAFTVLGGAVALGVGFGSQNVINNFISGLILHAERPVKVGDLIQLDDLYGNVEHIGARSTRVRTGSNLEIIVPNSTFLQNNVINFTLSSDKVRTLVEVGVIYGSPVMKVTQLLRQAVLETGRVSKDPPPIILFKNFGDNSLMFEIHFWIRMRTVMDRLQVESAVRYRIDQLFGEAGITIAFPQRDVHLDTSSPLQIEMMAPNAPNSETTSPNS